MSYLEFSSIFSLTTCYALAIFLFLQKKRNKSGILWGVLCVVAGTWNLGFYIISKTTNYELAYKGHQIANIGTILGPIVHHHFVCVYLGLRKKLQLILLYSFGTILLAVLILEPEIYLGRLEFLFNEFYYIYWFNDKSLIYTIMFILEYGFLLFYSFHLLKQNLLSCKKEKKNQIKYLMFGSIVGWIGGLSDFLPIFGIKVYPYFNILLGIFPLIIGYAIIRHNAMDIKIVVRKGILYSLLIASLSVIYLTGIFILEHFFRNIFGYQSLAISITLAIIIAIIFIPLRNFLQHLIDRFVFKISLETAVEENEMLLREVGEKEKFKAVATLASGIAHEIKNPLQAIKTFTEYLPQKYTDEEFVEKFSSLVGEEVDRIDDLVHQLLDYSKPQKIKIEETNIIKILDNTVEILSSKMMQNKIELKKGFNRQEEIFLNLDPTLIRQVLYNLIINAIEIMPHGGTLCINTIKMEDSFYIQVMDTGPGITKENLKYIFDAFFTRKDEGAGLGLAICKSIIEQHKGDIRVISSENGATVFEISLPL